MLNNNVELVLRKFSEVFSNFFDFILFSFKSSTKYLNISNFVAKEIRLKVNMEIIAKIILKFISSEIKAPVANHKYIFEFYFN